MVRSGGPLYICMWVKLTPACIYLRYIHAKKGVAVFAHIYVARNLNFLVVVVVDTSAVCLRVGVAGFYNTIQYNTIRIGLMV